MCVCVFVCVGSRGWGGGRDVLEGKVCVCVCVCVGSRGWGGGRDVLEGKGPQRRPRRRFDGGLEKVAKAVGGGYCQLQMPLKRALAVRGTVAWVACATRGPSTGIPESPSGWATRRTSR